MAGGDGERRVETPESMPFCFEDTSTTYSEEDDVVSEEEEEEEEDSGSNMEWRVPESNNQEVEQALVIRQEEFAELESGGDESKEERVEKLKDTKVRKVLKLCVVW